MPSLHNFAHVCSNLQNCSKVRLGITSMPMSKLHLRFALALQRQGIISTVQLGGTRAPLPPGASVPVGDLPDKLAASPWDAYVDPQSRQEPDRDEEYIPDNPAERRIWVGLKYWRTVPVLTKARVVSKPSRKIKITLDQIHRVVRGFRAGDIAGLTRPGECLFIDTTEGVLESREAMEKGIGGMALCRVW